MSPTSITGSGCSLTSTVTLSILTTPVKPVGIASIGGNGRGPWSLVCLFAGLGLALFAGLRGRHMGKRFSQIGMALALLIASSGLMACNTYNVNAPPPTPTGTYTLTVTATGSAGGTSAITFPLTVH
jgi:hypothetical protein